MSHTDYIDLFKKYHSRDLDAIPIRWYNGTETRVTAMLKQRDRTSGNKAGRKPKFIRRFFRIVFTVTVSIFALAFAVVLLLHIPPVQNKAGDWLIQNLSKASGKDITCDSIRFSLTGHIELQNLVIRHHPRFGDEEMGSVRKLYILFDPISLIGEKLVIREIFAESPSLRIVVLPDRNHNFQKNPFERKPRKKMRDRDDDTMIRQLFSRVRYEHVTVKEARFVLDYQPKGYILDVPSLNIECHQPDHSDLIRVKTRGFCVKNSHPTRVDSIADVRVEADVAGDGVRHALVTLNSADGKIWFFSNCSLSNFRHPSLEFNGTLRCELDSVRNLTKVNPILNGSADICFHGSGLAEDLTVDADCYAENVHFGQFRFASVSGPATYRNRTILIREATGSAYDGTITGTGLIGLQKDNQSLHLNASASNADLAGLLKDLRIPFELSTSLDVNLEMLSNGFRSENIVVTGTAAGLEKRRPGSPTRRNGDWDPLRLVGEFTFKDNVFELSKASMANEEHVVRMDRGSFGKTILRGQLEGTTSDPTDLARRIDFAVPLNYRSPELGGLADFRVRFDGQPHAYTVTGGIHSDELTAFSQILGAVDVDFDVTPEKLTISNLSASGPSLQSTGSLAWWIPPPQSGRGLRIRNASIRIDSMDLSLVRNVFGLPLDGAATGSIEMAEPDSEAPLRSRLRLSNLKLADTLVDTAEIDVVITPDTLSDGRLEARIGDGSVNARFDYPLNGRSHPDIHILASDIPFRSVPKLTVLEPGGSFDGKAWSQIDGDQWELRYLVTSDGISSGSHVSDGLNIDGTIRLTDNPTVTWNAMLHHDALVSSGTCILKHPYDCTIETTLSQFPLAVFSDIINRGSRTPHPFAGSVSLSTCLQGSLRDTSTIRGDIDTSMLLLEYMGIKLQLESPTTFTLMNRTISIPPLSLIHPFAHITLNGAVRADRTLSLDTDATIDLQGLERLTGFFTSTRGNCDLNLKIAGSWFDPNFSGACRIQEFFAYLPLFNSGLEDYHAEIVFNQKIGKINYMDGLAGGAYFGGTGEFGIARYVPELFDIRMDGSDIEFEYPRGFQSTGNVRLEISGSLPEVNLSGDIDLNQSWFRSRINYKTMIVNESRAKLDFLEKRKTFQISAGARPFFNPQFNLSVKADDNVFIDNNIANVELNLDLDVLGSLKKPRILGHVDALHGDVTFLQRRFELISASIDFADPARFDPVIVLQAGANIDDYRVILDVSGRVYSDLSIRPSSTPPLNDLDLWNLLLIGKTREEMVSGEDYLAGGVAYVTGSIQEQIERRFEYWMGFDEFSIDPLMSTSDESPSARFTVKKRFGPDLSVLYSRSASSAGDLLLLEYQVSDNLFIIGHKKEDNSVGADLIYRWEFGE